jgi:hypothetical protein
MLREDAAQLITRRLVDGEGYSNAVLLPNFVRWPHDVDKVQGMRAEHFLALVSSSQCSRRG